MYDLYSRIVSRWHNRSVVQICRDISRDRVGDAQDPSIVNFLDVTERKGKCEMRSSFEGLSLHREWRCKMSAGEKREGGDGGGGVATA